MSRTPPSVTDMQNRMDAELEEQQRQGQLEERIKFLESKMKALEWAIAVTPGLAELDRYFERRKRDPNYVD